MSSSTFPCSASDYERGVKIGSGSFSQVWSAKCVPRDTWVAVKVMDLESISSSFEEILKEVQTMRLADDPNILRCFCSFVHSDQLWLVTELMDKGSCVRVMHEANALGLGEGMSEAAAAYVLQEVIKGLNYLHKQGQIHRDIKPGNILLNSAGEVKLADFGVSGWTLARGQRVNSVKTFVGTPCYMAPEVLEQAGGYDAKADIWSLGITTLELAKGKAPYAQLPPMRILIRTIEDEPPSLASYEHDRQLSPEGAPFSDHFRDFFSKCLQKTAKARPRTEELLKHKLFKHADKKALMSQLLDAVSVVGSGCVPSIVDLHTAELLDLENKTTTEAAAEKSLVPSVESSAAVGEQTSAPSDPTPVPPAEASTVAVMAPPAAELAAVEEESVSNGVSEQPRNAPRAPGMSYVPGTSWVFEEEEPADGAVASKGGEDKNHIDDFLEDFETSM